MASADGAHSPAPGQITELLVRWQAGQGTALDDLLPLVYRELKDLARAHLKRERAGHTLQPTALVHEAFLRLIEQKRVAWRDRSHFLAIAAQCMRRVLVDHARRRAAQKRGADPVLVALDSDVRVPGASDVLALDDALKVLEQLDARQHRVVELRYFAGLGIEDIASTLNMSPSTVKREWATARAWLRRELFRAPR
ncbi:MAG: sigma-70 family RNA polymerase sigma factor [Vicinamibacterales bacterium]